MTTPQPKDPTMPPSPSPGRPPTPDPDRRRPRTYQASDEELKARGWDGTSPVGTFTQALLGLEPRRKR